MKYIINADDFGRTQTVNEAITKGFLNGTLTRTTIMVNMPLYEDAIAIAKQHEFFDKIGLHINLISGQPLTDEIKTCTAFADGENFNGEFLKQKLKLLFLTLKERRAVKKEIRAQIEKYIDAGFTLMHADSHGHVHTFPSLAGIVLGELKRYQFRSVRISRNVRISSKQKVYKRVLNYGFMKFNRKFDLQFDAQYFDSFKAVLSSQEKLRREGICEIMLHPNIFDGDMQIGEGKHYEDLQLFLKQR